MKAQLLILATAFPLIAAFTQTTLRNLHQRLHNVNDINTAVVKPRNDPTRLTAGYTVHRRPSKSSSSRLFISKFRTAALFARPKAEFAEDDEDDEDENDIDYEDDDDEDEEDEDGKDISHDFRACCPAASY